MRQLPTGGLFQLGYVSADIERAIALYRDRYGVREFLRINSRALSPPDAHAPFLDLALAYTGDLMIELIQPDACDPGIYGDALRSDGRLSLHHLGYMVEPDRFATLAEDCRGSGVAVPARFDNAGVAVLFADTR